MSNRIHFVQVGTEEREYADGGGRYYPAVYRQVGLRGLASFRGEAKYISEQRYSRNEAQAFAEALGGTASFHRTLEAARRTLIKEQR